MIVPADSSIPGYEQPREKLLEGWFYPSLPRREKEQMAAFRETGDTSKLSGPARRGVEATWNRVCT